MAISWSQSRLRRERVLLLLIVTLGIVSRCCDCAGLSKQYLTANRRGGNGDGGNRLYLGNWDSAVPTYALNWARHQGTTEDLAEANAKGIYGENDMLATWAAAAASEEDMELDSRAITNEDIKKFKSNPCAPGRDCTHYEQVGYVFNSMTL